MSVANLISLWDRRDAIDHREGLMAYRRYRRVMQAFADHYGFPLKDVTSAFVALSPNSDYHGNLRSQGGVSPAVFRQLRSNLKPLPDGLFGADTAQTYEWGHE